MIGLRGCSALGNNQKTRFANQGRFECEGNNVVNVQCISIMRAEHLCERQEVKFALLNKTEKK